MIAYNPPHRVYVTLRELHMLDLAINLNDPNVLSNTLKQLSANQEKQWWIRTRQDIVREIPESQRFHSPRPFNGH